jgi:hypothetical protein
MMRKRRGEADDDDDQFDDAQDDKYAPKAAATAPVACGFAGVPEIPSLVGGLLISIVGMLLYMDILENQFVMDDKKAIVNNADLRPNVPISTLFAHDYWGTPMESKYSHKSYRWVAYFMCKRRGLVLCKRVRA